MAGDLERFLQQAAERLKQKLEQANQPAPPPVNKPPTVRQAERVRPVIVAELADEEERRKRADRALGPNPLSNIDTRPALAQQISQTDEKMAERLHEKFDHNVSQIKAASSAFDSVDRPITQSSGLRVRSKQASPMVKMLRNPDTLRSAFIASEIFSRKF